MNNIYDTDLPFTYKAASGKRIIKIGSVHPEQKNVLITTKNFSSFGE